MDEKHINIMNHEGGYYTIMLYGFDCKGAGFLYKDGSTTLGNIKNRRYNSLRFAIQTAKRYHKNVEIRILSNQYI